MPVLDWFRPPRQLLTFYLAGTLAAAAALVWLGWRMIDQERALDAKRAQDRLESAADRIVARFQVILDELERQLSTAGGTLPGDTVVLDADQRSVTARPKELLVFCPVVAKTAEPPPGIFRSGETAEFDGDLPKAIAIYRELARLPARPVRAAVLVRLGRCLRKAARLDEALQTYADLTLLEAVSVEGLPADLVAREARCAVLEKMGRRAALDREARELYRDLATGHWQLTHATWEFTMEEARSWVGSDLPSFPGLNYAISLSTAGWASDRLCC